MKHAMIPTKNPNIAIDRNDPEKAKTAIELEWPETFSRRAKMVIKYLEGTAFLFSYNDHIVITDESLELTAFGDGSPEAPLGFPRYEDNTLEGVEAWLEEVADQYDADGDIPGWEEAKAAFEAEEAGQSSEAETVQSAEAKNAPEARTAPEAWAKKHLRSLASHGAKLVVQGELVPFDETIWDKAMAECQKEGFQAIMYSMRIPETDEPMGLAIYRNGRVDSGSEKVVIDCMAQY